MDNKAKVSAELVAKGLYWGCDSDDGKGERGEGLEIDSGHHPSLCDSDSTSY